MATRIGGPGPDTLLGTAAFDILDGRGGNDRLFGRAGDDSLRGGIGNDVLNGEGGRDLMQGDGGNDAVNGNDDLQVNNDDAHVGAGNDHLETFHTGSRLAGGGGADRFLPHTQTDDGPDQTVVTDFSPEDTLTITAHNVSASDSFGGLRLFDRLDTSDDGILDGEDGSQTTAGGTFLSVQETANALTITLGDDVFDFLNIDSMARAEWA